MLTPCPICYADNLQIEGLPDTLHERLRRYAPGVESSRRGRQRNGAGGITKLVSLSQKFSPTIPGGRNTTGYYY